MANTHQVVITLTPVYSPDTLPFRSLTFSSDEDTTPIGRASKSEIKNLLPEHDNGWFDSRVMSRNHAVLSVHMEDKARLHRPLLEIIILLTGYFSVDRFCPRPWFFTRNTAERRQNHTKGERRRSKWRCADFRKRNFTRRP